MKKCYKCHKTKKNKEFNKNKATKDGLQTYCRDCQRENNHKRFIEDKAKNKIKRIKDKPPVYSFEKYCVNCEKVKDKTEFFKNSKAKDGLQSYCKKCMKLKKRKQTKRQKHHTTNNTIKYCPKCNTTKNISEFNKKIKAKDGLQYCCKKCQYKSQQNYMKKYNKQYYKKHHKKEHEIEYKIPVRIIKDKTHIGSAAYTATFNAAQAEQQRINEEYDKAIETYANKILCQEQKHMNVWERIKFIIKG